MADIQIKKLSKFYPLEDGEIRALDGIDLDIKSGTFVVILGQSGCGKSTLLSILGGMDRPSSGEILIGNHNLAAKKSDQLARYRREQVGMVFQKFNLVNDMSLLENIMLSLKFSGLGERAQKRLAQKALDEVGLLSRAKSSPSKLSGGQQQRVAIARALVNNPEILLCDEPTGNLDSKTGQEIIQLLQDLNKKGHTIIMVTHNEEYSKFADHVVKMLDGHIIDETYHSQTKNPTAFQTTKTKTINFFASLKLALKNLKRRKSRIFLTTFGIAIGAMAILVLISFGDGLQNEATKEMKSYGQVNQITVSNTKTTGTDYASNNFLISQTTPLNDANVADFKKIASVSAVYPSVTLEGQVIYGDKAGRLFLQAAAPLNQDQSDAKKQVKYGKYFTSDSDNSVILPYGLAQALGFQKAEDIIGKEVTLKAATGQEKKMTVIGLLTKDDHLAYQSLVPLTAGINFLKDTKAEELKKANPDLYSSITVVSKDAGSVAKINKAIAGKGFATHSYADTAKDMNRIFLMVKTGLGIVGAIAMLVASLGIINTMMMSILERTREIGIMKAVGARARDIRGIFLSEAFVIGLIGGLLGLLIGYPCSKLASLMFNGFLNSSGAGGNEIKFIIEPYLAGGVILFSILVSVLAGYFPARRAAKLDPIIALRDE